ncbi:MULTISPECIES: carbohydrate ABC transporter permease [Bifidobacterium]|uniref:carbohydrate ABC transporter permease n=1 Tax=Bifidobacterium TaxID=1678 RepID=UPI001C614123|nr:MULTISPECIES: hypothetical protein [Bifidobacterium]
MSSFTEFGTLVRNRHRPKDKPKDTKVALGFLAPWLIGVIFLSLIPMLYSLVISFKKYNMIKPPQFVGLMNYRHMLVDPRFLSSLKVTLTYVVISVPCDERDQLVPDVHAGVRRLRRHRRSVRLDAVYTLYLYQQRFASLRMGYASALAWIMVLIVAALTGINFALSKFWVHYDD